MTAPHEMMGVRINRIKVGYGALLLALSGPAVWSALPKPPSITNEQTCKAKCYPLPWTIEGERRLPNAPEGWRNYERWAKCVCS